MTNTQPEWFISEDETVFLNINEIAAFTLDPNLMLRVFLKGTEEPFIIENNDVDKLLNLTVYKIQEKKPIEVEPFDGTGVGY